jgi:hypothetical protein
MMNTNKVEEKEESAMTMRARTSPTQQQQQHDNELGAIASDQALKNSGGTVLSYPYNFPLRLKRVRPYMDHMALVVVIAAWYGVGALAIVTTKLLVTTWRVPPLLLTAQQFFLASTILRTVLAFGKGAQPWPVDKTRFNLDFAMAGLFNSLDFLASNAAFSASAASFVETIKASEPITTTAVALVWQVDRLGLHESGCLVLLVAGVFLSTVGNAAAVGTKTRTDEEAEIALEHSTRIALTVMSANLCFAFRALSQKRYRTSRPASDQLDDINLLCGMLQVGALISLPAALWIHGGSLADAMTASSENQKHYAGLTLLNAVSFATYNWASCYVLSHVSVLHHSSLNCLRRMFVTIATSIFFGVKMTLAGGTGIAMSFAGFLSFTHYRRQRRKEEQQLKPKDSNV